MGPNMIIFLLPALVASTDVYIKAVPSQNKASVYYVGQDLQIINDVDKKAFNLTNSTLKAAVKAYSGGTPTDVFLTRPTPWGDLYTTYRWSEVRRYTNIKKVNVLAVKTEKVTLAKQDFINNLTSGDSTFTADMKADVVNYVSVTNSKTVSAEVKYYINFDEDLKPPMSMKVQSNLDKHDNVVKETKKIKAETEVKFTLKPSQSAKCILNATKVDLYLAIYYASGLDGKVVTNYYPKYKDHHFWSYDVRDILKAGNMPLLQNSTTLVNVQYYIKATVSVIDQSNGKTVASVPADYVL